MNDDRLFRFGHHVLGPIAAEYVLSLYGFAAGLARHDETTLLFCARGGLQMQRCYEAFLKAAGLESPVAVESLMVSRLVAARLGLLSGAKATREQIGHDLPGASAIDIAKSFSLRKSPELRADPRWAAPFEPASFAALIATPQGAAVAAEIDRQNALFLRHLEARAGGRPHIVLCDTGLFGSTHQMLEESLPRYRWSSALIARANYKHFEAPHFARAVGLLVEADSYRPWRRRTAMLRYWYLVESLFEPKLPSVRRFEEVDGEVRANLETPGWRAALEGEPGSLFAGALAYIEALGARAALKIVSDAPAAWARLHRVCVWPTRQDAETFDVGERSADFGSDARVAGVGRGRGLKAILTEGSLWREGEIALSTSAARLPLLSVIEAGYVARLAKRALMGR